MPEALSFYRESEKKSNLQTIGIASIAGVLYGLLSVTAEQEERIKTLPVYSAYQLPLQNAKGERYFIPGLDTPGDPRHPIRTG